MTAMLRVRTVWSGFNGAPGYTNLFFHGGATNPGEDDQQSQTFAASAYAKARTFMAVYGPVMPTDVTLTVDPNVDVLEETNGELVTSYAVAPGLPITGTDQGTYSVVSGGVISWNTSGIRRGRRIRGRTFLVPLAGNQYTSDGRLTTSSVDRMRNAAAALIADTTGARFGVWARPSGPGATDGEWHPVTSAKTSDLPAILRSRRD